jgi:hypothetical protein
MHMSRNTRLRLLASTLLAVIATAALSVGTVLADGGGPPWPK